MKMKFASLLMTGLVLLAGCQHGPVGQALDNKTALLVNVHGDALASLQKQADTGETLHRVVESSDRKEVLFAYDIDVKKSPGDGSWKFLLKPSTQKPTFEKAREVTVQSADETVRVELLEQPETGQKIVDVFELQSVQTHKVNVSLTDAKAHVIKLHNRLFQYLHGN